MFRLTQKEYQKVSREFISDISFWGRAENGDSGLLNDDKEFEQSLEHLADEAVKASFQHFKKNKATFAQLNERSVKLFSVLNTAHRIELLQDSPDTLKQTFNKLRPQELQLILNIASVLGAVKTCKLLIEKYHVIPTTDAVTLAFLAPSVDVAEYFIEELDELSVGPRLAVAANLTALNLNEPLLDYLNSTYGRERLRELNTNMLATAAYHPDQEKALNFIKKSLKIFTPDALSLLSAFEAKNFAAFEVMLKASPELAVTAQPFLVNNAENSNDAASVTSMLELLNDYKNEAVEYRHEAAEAEHNRPSIRP